VATLTPFKRPFLNGNWAAIKTLFPKLVFCHICSGSSLIYLGASATSFAELLRQMAEYMTARIATSTQRNYNAYVRYYLSFCSEFHLRPRQPDKVTICLYVTRLAETCVYRTIKSYLTGVRLLHLEADLANPLPSFFNLDRTLRGIKRVKGDTNHNRKLAVTPDLLARVIRRLDLFSPFTTLPSSRLCSWPFLDSFAKHTYARPRNLAPLPRIFPCKAL
jgi:hypothetical protein